MQLSESQSSQFYDEGYLILENVFDDSDLQPVIDDIEAEIARIATELVVSGELSRDYAEEDFTTRLSRITQETEAAINAIYSGQLATPGIFGLLSNPKLLDIVESLVGQEIIAASAYRLRPKLPGYGPGVVPWHQDSAFFEPYCDTSLILTVWIPLVDATAERGCLEVLPRQNHGGIVTHHVPEDSVSGLLEIMTNELPIGDIITAEVPKGGALLLTNRTPHRSTENVSDVIRWSMDLRYQSAELPTNFQIADETFMDTVIADDIPVACYPPEADFLVRSVMRPEAVVKDWNQFKALRTNHVKVSVTDRWGLRRT